MEHAIALQQQRMRDRADPDNVVYEYQYDEPERLATPEQAVKMAQLAFDERRKLKELQDSDARSRILESDANVAAGLKVFSRTHPRAFELVTELQRGAEHLQVFVKMARLRKAANENGASEAQATAYANELLQAHCARGPAAQSQG